MSMQAGGAVAIGDRMMARRDGREAAARNMPRSVMPEMYRMSPTLSSIWLEAYRQRVALRQKRIATLVGARAARAAKKGAA